MSRKPAKKMIRAPAKNPPTAKKAAAPKFTTSPRKVRKLELPPVPASAPTILSSSHLLPVPIAPVSVAIFLYKCLKQEHFREMEPSYPPAGILHQPRRSQQTAAAA